MTKFTLGEKVSSPDRIFRRSYAPTNYTGFREWLRYSDKQYKPRPVSGVFVGYRTYANGKVLYDYEEGNIFKAVEHVKVALIVEHERRNPVPVLLEDVTCGW